jgi:hypothetical protein
MDCPFRTGVTYRVRRDFKALRDEFCAGERLVFKRTGDSRYDEMTGFFFTAVEGGAWRSWDLGWDDDVSVWRDLFEPEPAFSRGDVVQLRLGDLLGDRGTVTALEGLDPEPTYAVALDDGRQVSRAETQLHLVRKAPA